MLCRHMVVCAGLRAGSSRDSAAACLLAGSLWAWGRAGQAGRGRRRGGVRAPPWSVTNTGSSPASRLPFIEPEGLSHPRCARSATGQRKYRPHDGRPVGLRACEEGEEGTVELWGLEGLKALEVPQCEQENSPHGCRRSQGLCGNREPAGCVTLGMTLNLAEPPFPYR